MDGFSASRPSCDNCRDAVPSRRAAQPGHPRLQVITNRIYQIFRDSFDFVVLVHADAEKPDSLYFGKCFPVQNQVRGIGKKLFNDSGKWGSTGRLKGVVHLTRNDAIREGPILHELSHLWANEFMETGQDGHWGFTGVGGQLGGFQRIVHLRDNYYKGFVPGQTGFSPASNWGNALPYAPLELYLMGLLSAEEVPPITIAQNPEGDPSHNGLFTASGLDTICMEDLVQKHGLRKPAFPEAQNEFRGVVVLLSEAPVSDFLFDRINEEVRQFAAPGAPVRNWRLPNNWWGKENFFSATGGRGCLELGKLESLLKEPAVTMHIAKQ